jgi:hypothetical protein
MFRKAGAISESFSEQLGGSRSLDDFEPASASIPGVLGSALVRCHLLQASNAAILINESAVSHWYQFIGYHTIK